MADKSMKVDIYNQRKLEKALRAIGKDAVDDLKVAHRKSAEIVEAAARPKVPVRSGSSSVISNKPYWPGRRGSSGGALKGTLRAGASVAQTTCPAPCTENNVSRGTGRRI